MDRVYALVNVFTLGSERFSGNPLAVFDAAGEIAAETMQNFARELNLSETTFVLPATNREATARVRIFTPAYEMPFAGHPTLGTAHVIARRNPGRNPLALEMTAGLVEVTVDGGHVELRTPYPPRVRAWAAEGGGEALAAAMGVPKGAFAEEPLWVDTGVEQLVVELREPALVRSMRPDAAALLRVARSPRTNEGMVYAFSRIDALHVEARFVFSKGAALVEDPATGSACANLGGYLLANGRTPPLHVRVRQGKAVDRPSELHLRVDEHGAIHVGGFVRAVGGGTLQDD